MKQIAFGIGILLVFTFFTQRPVEQFDIIIKNGLIYDGSGKPPYRADIGIVSDTIAAIGNFTDIHATPVIDAKGLAVAPGFINMLSWADGSLLKDGRSMSDIKQGVTLEVFGEGYSPGPRKRNPKDTLWRTLGEYFKQLERKGISPNIASFVGATTVRVYVLDRANRNPTAEELEQMKNLVRQAMREGAMGLGSSLIYAPADYASTKELIELSKAAAEYGGMYITHMRNENDRILPAMNEAFTIAREAKIPTEIYHLKINQQRNWNKIDTVLQKIDSARKAGLKITANMYPYIASATDLIARIPTWVQEGGAREMRKRLKDPVIRQKVLRDLELGIPSKNSDPKNVLIMSFGKDSLNELYRGKRLDEVARLHGKSADETMLDLLIRDSSTIPCTFFLISEENVKRMISQPYVSICSDAGSMPAEDPYLKETHHPRAYGSFARFLSNYVRDEKLMTLEEGIRRMTGLPAENLKIKKRGKLLIGNFADIVLFDPNTIEDNATFDNAHQYATGVEYVIVNGKIVIDKGNHTGAMPGRFVPGPGYLK